MSKDKIVKKTGFLFLSICISVNLFGQFSHQLKGSVLPWTEEPVIAGNDFRFVVIGDLTGCEEEGVFESVIPKINQFSPDFVISVGDLIEGYTSSQKNIDMQWGSLESRLRMLEPPFFYVPGNHDIGNPLLLHNWKNRFGHTWYSFQIGHSLFVVMGMFEPGETTISDGQLLYLKNILEDHDPRYPVYFFSHAPLWDKFNKKGYSELEPLLKKFKTTYFCGHQHHYLLNETNEQNHIMLAKTGGGFQEQNLNLGLFNHFLFCTVRGDSLQVANILTDGVISPRIVNNQTEKQVSVLLNRQWFSIQPTVIGSQTSGLFQSNLTIRNEGDYPMQVNGRLPSLIGLEITPGVINETVPQGAEISISLSLTNPENILVEDLPEIPVELKGVFFQEEKEIEGSASHKWMIDNYKSCFSSPVDVRGYSCAKPGEVEESWCWNGPLDGNFEFSTWYDSASIQVSISTIDDLLISDFQHPEKVQDRLIIQLSNDTLQPNCKPVVFEFPAKGNSKMEGTKSSLSINGNSLVANLSIPKTWLESGFFRLNIGFADLDDPESDEPSVIWWKPRWGSVHDYPESGVFLLKN